MTSEIALGPPVDAPITTTFSLILFSVRTAERSDMPVDTDISAPACRNLLRLLSINREMLSLTRNAFLIFVIISERTLSMSSESSPEGFATKSNAPRSSAFIVIFAFLFVYPLNITTGIGSFSIMRSTAVMPSIFGISTSIVMTSGCSESAFFTASSPSLATPTTSISSSLLSMSEISTRINAESSTTSTLIFSALTPSFFITHHATHITASRHLNISHPVIQSSTLTTHIVTAAMRHADESTFSISSNTLSA